MSVIQGQPDDSIYISLGAVILLGISNLES